MNQLIQMMKRKWIDGECRKLCCVCPYWEKYCKVVYLPNSKYSKGYELGFKDGYEAGFKSDYKTVQIYDTTGKKMHK